ncbi:MAG: LysR family transcriptional regulator, partial [Thauera phenolivorans]|nr:LysR family transcriptional regulator [Thauera phenolivorans]
MRLTLHQLRLLLAVSREGSVTRAAQRLHLTQPTLSAQLRQLAEQVGLPLYERIGRRLHLTAAGAAVVDTAARLELEFAQLDETLAGLRGDAGGRLRLAVVSTAETFIPRLLGEFRRARPAVEVSLVVLNRDAVLRRLADNLDELYIMSRPPGAPVVSATPFLSNPLVVIAGAGHPLAGRRAIPPAALAAEEFVLREPGSGTRQAAEAFFAAHGV